MGFANRFDFARDISFDEYGRVLEVALENEYPGCCKICGWEICKCPPVPAVTLGRIAKDAPIDFVFPGRKALSRAEESMALFGRVETALKIGERVVRLDKAEFDRIASV